jgi:hypothetical protein
LLEVYFVLARGPGNWASDTISEFFHPNTNRQ